MKEIRDINQQVGTEYATGKSLIDNFVANLVKLGLYPRALSRSVEATSRQVREAPASAGQTGQSRESQTATDSLAQLVREFNVGPLTPELVTSTFQEIWKVRGEAAGLELPVLPCDRTVEELAALVKTERRIGYLPERLMTQQDRSLLARMFPKLGNHSVQEGNSVTNEINRFGWFDYEASVDAPYRNTTENQLRVAIDAEGKTLGRELVGMNVSEYIVAGEDSKLFAGRYLDQEGSIWARLLGSRDDDEVVDARFDSSGGLSVGWNLHSRTHSPALGGRSVGVKS